MSIVRSNASDHEASRLDNSGSEPPKRGLWLDALSWMGAVILMVGIVGGLACPSFMEDCLVDTEESRMTSNLATIRQAISLYREQHNGKLPTSAIVNQLILTTDIDGRFDLPTSAIGPYLRSFPPNPVNDLASVLCVVRRPSFTDDTSGWWYDLTTGAFGSNSSGTAPNGTRYSDF